MVGRRDARRLKPAAQELLRRQAVAAVRGGMTQAEAARVFGASERAVNEWMARSRAGGVAALAARRRGRRAGPRRLTPRQARRIRRLVEDRMPDQLKLPFYLWTREMREWGLELILVLRKN